MKWIFGTIFVVLFSSSLCRSFDFLNELNVTLEGAEEPPGAGVFLQISSHGLKYMSQMAQTAIPKLLTNYSIPDTSAASFSLKDLTIKNISTPEITTGFLNKTGVYAELVFAETELVGGFKAGIGWFSKEGVFRGVAKDFTLKMIMTAKRGSRDQPTFHIPVCQGQTEEIQLMFAGGFSGVLNTVRPLMESYLASQLDDILCQVLREATEFFEEEITKRRPDNMGQQFNPSLLCGGFKGENGEGENRPLPDFDVNFVLTGEPYFTNTHALLGMDGGLLYKGSSAGIEVPASQDIHWGSKMISFQLTEYVPNTFAKHIYANRLGVIEETLDVDDLPGILRAPLSALCWSCEIRLVAGPLEPPVTRFTKDGIILAFKGELRIIIDGPFKQFDLMNAKLNMEIHTNFVVRRNTLYGRDAELVNFDVSLQDIGIGGVLGEPISDVMNLIVPKQVWPRVRKRLRFALNRKGIRLPVVCGVRLQDTEIKYYDGAVLVDTDFRYNLGRFMHKFKRMVLNKKKENQ